MGTADQTEVIVIHPSAAPPAQGPGATGFRATYPVMPAGLVAHANRLLAAGFTVRGINVAVEQMLAPDFRAATWMEAQGAPALLLIDLHWYEHAAAVVELVACARRVWPDTLIAVGGLTATRFAHELLRLCPAIDVVVRGDAEESVLGLASCATARPESRLDQVPNVTVRDTHGSPVDGCRGSSTSCTLLDESNGVDLGFLDNALAYERMVYSYPPQSPWGGRGRWLINGRGCAFDCSYCGGGRSAHEALTGLRKVIRRTPDAIASDIGRLLGRGIDQVSLTLDPDMLGRAHRTAFFDALHRRALRPGLYVESFQLPSEALLDSLALGSDLDHTEVAITPLSGSESVRRHHGKRFSNEALLHSAAELVSRGLSLFAFFSLNLPGEDHDTMAETTDLARRLLALGPEDQVRVINICHTLDPVSLMGATPERFAVQRITLRSLQDYVEYCRGPRPWRFVEGERGFTVPGRDLQTMVASWNVLSESYPGRAIAVPTV